MKDVNEEIKKLTPAYGALTQAEIRTSDDLRKDTEKLFAKFGPELWTDDDQKRSAWLADASKDTLGGSYPQNLYYSNADDRER